MAFVEALQDSQYLLQVTYPQLCMRIPWVQGADGDSAEEADDMTCAICLERTPLIEIALVKGCEHQYCGECPTPAHDCWKQGPRHALLPLTPFGLSADELYSAESSFVPVAHVWLLPPRRANTNHP